MNRDKPKAATVQQPKPVAPGGERVALEISDHVGLIKFVRPSRGNAIDLQFAEQFEQAVRRCESESDVRAVSMVGDGAMFCSGGDLAAIQAQGSNAPAYVREILRHLNSAISTIDRMPIPVVAGIQGAAAGAGLALACCCDLAIATETSRFLMAYSRVGLTPDAASTWFLPRAIGTRRALELALTGRELGANEALAWGLVNSVVPEGELAARLENLTRALAAGPAGALGTTKRLLRTSLANELEVQSERETNAICEALTSRDAATGLASFLARTKPSFEA